MHDALAFGVPSLAVVIAALLTRRTAKDTGIVVEAKGSIDAFMKIIERERRDRVNCEKKLEILQVRIDSLERGAARPNPQPD